MKLNKIICILQTTQAASHIFNNIEWFHQTETSSIQFCMMIIFAFDLHFKSMECCFSFIQVELFSKKKIIELCVVYAIE